MRISSGLRTSPDLRTPRTPLQDFEGAELVELSFSKNGQELGAAFHIRKEALQERALLPHVLCKGCAVELNFGQRPQPLAPVPEGFQFIHDVPAPERVRTPPGPKSTEECEVRGWGGFLGVSWAFLGDFCGISLGDFRGFSWDSLGGFLEILSGVPWGFPWDFLGILLGVSLDFPQDFCGILSGVPLGDFRGILLGISVGFPWDSLRGSLAFPGQFPWSCLGASLGVPHWNWDGSFGVGGSGFAGNPNIDPLGILVPVLLDLLGIPVLLPGNPSVPFSRIPWEFWLCSLAISVSIPVSHP